MGNVETGFPAQSASRPAFLFSIHQRPFVSFPVTATTPNRARICTMPPGAEASRLRPTEVGCRDTRVGSAGLPDLSRAELQEEEEEEEEGSLVVLSLRFPHRHQAPSPGARGPSHTKPNLLLPSASPTCRAWGIGQGQPAWEASWPGSGDSEPLGSRPCASPFPRVSHAVPGELGTPPNAAAPVSKTPQEFSQQ